MNVPSAPLTLGRYVLYAPIAQGGMAAVHFGRLSTPAGFSRTVAIKRLHANLAQDPEFVRMFLDEARIASRVRHPNVMTTNDVVAENGELFLVMEYIHGETLAQLCKQTSATSISESIISAILVDLLRGLHAAHDASDERGAPLEIVHRDISPQNVLVGADGAARVLDFGIAKSRGRLQNTVNGQVKGKLAYMAPEQFSGGNSSRRIDIYAAGAVLWELLAQRRLFVARTEQEMVVAVLAGKIAHPVAQESAAPPAPVSPIHSLRAAPRPRAVSRTSLRQQLGDIALRALSRDPAERFATAAEMAQAIEKCVQPASSATVGEWVKTLAHDALAARARTLAAIESDDTAAGFDAAEALLAKLIHDKPRDDVPASAAGPQMSLASVPVAPRSRPAAAPQSLEQDGIDGDTTMRAPVKSVVDADFAREAAGAASAMPFGAAEEDATLTYQPSRRSLPSIADTTAELLATEFDKVPPAERTLKLHTSAVAAMVRGSGLIESRGKQPPATVRMHSNPDFARASGFFQAAAPPASARTSQPFAAQVPASYSSISVAAPTPSAAAGDPNHISRSLIAGCVALCICAFGLTLLAIRTCASSSAPAANAPAASAVLPR